MEQLLWNAAWDEDGVEVAALFEADKVGAGAGAGVAAGEGATAGAAATMALGTGWIEKDATRKTGDEPEIDEDPPIAKVTSIGRIPGDEMIGG